MNAIQIMALGLLGILALGVIGSIVGAHLGRLVDQYYPEVEKEDEDGS